VRANPTLASSILEDSGPVFTNRRCGAISPVWSVPDPPASTAPREGRLDRVKLTMPSVTMRQAHIGGDKPFVDYAGDTVPMIVDRLTGQVRPAQIFVAVMGASNFTYAEASWTQAWPTGSAPIPEPSRQSAACPNCWCPTTRRSPSSEPAFTSRRSIGPTPRWRPITTPRSCRPGRQPRDKAKVEVAVLIIERWLLGRLRHRCFYSLAELNTAIGELLRQLNDERPIRRLGVTRRTLFKELDRPNLNSLPAQSFALPNGGSAGLVSITTSSSTAIFTASPTALPAARSRCG
jgi:hypothetical protein